jgi:hypothetical protein
MNNNQFETKLKKHADDLFGKEKELPDGHRERFEQRLKNLSLLKNNVDILQSNSNDNEETLFTENRQNNPGKAVIWKIWLISTVAAAAVLAGIVFILNPFAKEQQSQELTNVRNYYNILLEEESVATRLLIQHVDEVNQEILLANVDLIENDPLPDVQMPDDDYIVLIAGFYTYKIELLQNIQNAIKTNVLNIN